MDQVPEEKKDSLTKTLAILGFVAIVILIVWLVVRVVALIPSAFSSLASIADTVYGPNTSELAVKTKNSVVNAGESFNISWNELAGNGSYGFEYECEDGVSIDLRDSNNAIRSVDCDTFVDLGTDTDVDVIVNAEKQRFTDIEYAVTYTREGAENVVTRSVVTIVNPTIPTGVTVAETVTETQDDTVNAINNIASIDTGIRAEDTNTTEVAPVNPTYTAGEPRVTEQFVYQIPVSDPNGVVDLQVKNLGVGETAFSFEIKNIGTKTATDWEYEVELPSDVTYKSGEQTALKPNERTIITLKYDSDGRKTATFSVDVDAEGDVNTKNNDGSWEMKIGG